MKKEQFFQNNNNTHTWEEETEGSEFQGHLQLNYVRSSKPTLDIERCPPPAKLIL